MRHLGFIAVVSIAVACAVQNNPTPDFEGNDGDSGASSGGTGAAGKATTGGVTQGGSVGKAGSSAGGTPSGGGSGGNLADVGGGGGGGKGDAGGMSGSGGKASSGGSSGGGGKAGAGGTSGGSAGSGGKGGGGSANGGSGGGGSNCTPSSSGPIQGLSARYQPEITNNGTAIGAQLELNNAGPSTLNLADLKVRYYLTNEVKTTVNTTINWGWYRPGEVDKKPKLMFAVVPMSCTTGSADSYIEFTFTADAGLLEPAHYVLFSFTAQDFNNQNFTQTNDYSFNAAAKIDADDSKIVVLQNSGTRAWGTEP